MLYNERAVSGQLECCCRFEVLQREQVLMKLAAAAFTFTSSKSIILVAH